MKLLVVYNRAAIDAGEIEYTVKDLFHPFVSALPPAVGTKLEENMALVFTQSNPFDSLFQMAPAKPTAGSSSTTTAITEINQAQPSGETR